MKSRSNPFLEPTSTKQWGESVLLNETTGAFAGGGGGGGRAHEWQIPSKIN